MNRNDVAAGKRHDHDAIGGSARRRPDDDRQTEPRRYHVDQAAKTDAMQWTLDPAPDFVIRRITVFIASPSTQTLPVKLYAYIAHTIDPLLSSISTVLILLTLVLMLLLERFYGLDRVLGGKS